MKSVVDFYQVTSAEKPKQYLNEVSRSSGDIYFSRSLSELPRVPRDIYNTKVTTSSNVS